MSKVFNFSTYPTFIQNMIDEGKIIYGGTGFFEADSPDLPTEVEHHFPDYTLYNKYIATLCGTDKKLLKKYSDYTDYSIGYTTRGCFRKCPFCVNRKYSKVFKHSPVPEFLDQTRKAIYLWDDNFLAADYTIWKPLLQELIDTKQAFQFRQGLDERMLAQSPHGEEMAKMLSKARYHGDFIFAFDNWRDRDTIEKALKIWKKHNPKKGTKFYLFCGFKLTEKSHDKFYKDIWELFQRIRVLMSYGCVGYVMRHEDYHKYEISNLYIQIARWCNQQQFYKKMSFWQFCYRNQSYWEENTLNVNNRPKLKTFEEFEKDVKDGYYEKVKMCLPLKSIIQIFKMFPMRRDDLIEMFNFTMSELIDKSLWE